METLSKKWVFILINASMVILLGLMLLLVPLNFLKGFIFVIGAVIAFVGLVLVFGAFGYARENKSMVFWLFQGLFNLVIGALVMLFPEASVKFLLILAGLWAIVLGIYQFSVGITSNPDIRSKTLLKINGAVSVVLGILFIFAPEIIAGIIVQILGVILLIIGGIMVYFSILLKQLGKITDAEIVDFEPENEEESIP